MKKVHPVVDLDVEGAEEALILEGTTLQHFLRFDLARISEVVDQQCAHLPTVAHFFDHDARDGPAVPIRGSIVEQVALLLHAGKLGIALVDDHVHQGISHLLRRHLAQVFPLAAAFVVSELDVFRVDRAVQRIEFECLDICRIDADLFAPVVEETDPVTECSDFCYFTRHTKTSFDLQQDGFGGIILQVSNYNLIADVKLRIVWRFKPHPVVAAVISSVRPERVGHLLTRKRAIPLNAFNGPIDLRPSLASR